MTIEMAPWVSQETGLILGERDYVLADQEDVVARGSGGAPSGTMPRVEAMPWQAWVEIMRRTSDLPDESPTEALVSAAAQLRRC